MKRTHTSSILLAMGLASSAAVAAPDGGGDATGRATPQATQAHAAFALQSFGPSAPLDSLPDARLAFANGESGTPTLAAVAQISASSDGDRATVRIGSSIPWQHDTGHDWMIGLDTWSLALSAPAGKSGSTQILSSGGLPSDFLVKFSFSQFIGDVVEDRAMEDSLFQKARDRFNKCTPTVDRTKYKSQDVYNAALYETCGSLQDMNSLITHMPPPEQRAYNEGIAENALLWGVDASIGYQKFDFFDPLTAAKNNSTGTPWSAGGFVAWSPGSSNILLSAGLEYQRSYQDGDTGTLCPLPAPAPTVLPCVTGAIGAPTRADKLLASLEFKKEVPLPAPLAAFGLGDLGVDAKFSYDTKSDVYGFDVPLSFIADKDGNLAGGVEFGWKSDSHNFVAGLFLSTAFSLMPGG